VSTNNLTINAYIQRIQNINKQLILISLLTGNTLPLNGKDSSNKVTDKNNTVYYENNAEEMNYWGKMQSLNFSASGLRVNIVI